MFQPLPDPESPLARHRVLSPLAGIKVSPLCLGAMNFGDAWAERMGKCDKNDSFALMDYFYEQGGTFIDTANNYQNEESETWIGEWMQKKKNRDHIVLATKYTSFYKGYAGEAGSAYTGNSAKSLRISLANSLRKLQTDYVDILYIHWWDWSTSIPEAMHALNDLVTSGKVLYLGISDTPAWVVSKANQYARDHGLRPFSIYQGMWNAQDRDLEREIAPMCLDEGMAIAPWKALGGGHFKTEEQHKSSEGRGDFYGPLSDVHKNMTGVLAELAQKRNTQITSIALAYVMNSMPDVYPIVGGRKVEHLKQNIEALKIRLTPEEINRIREASNWNAGFPHTMVNGPNFTSPIDINASTPTFLRSAEVLDVTPRRQPAFPPEAK